MTNQTPGPLSPLARARRRAGLTQVQLAARVGCHPMTIGTAERGALSAGLAQRCAEALGVAVEELLGARPAPKTAKKLEEALGLQRDEVRP